MLSGQKALWKVELEVMLWASGWARRTGVSSAASEGARAHASLRASTVLISRESDRVEVTVEVSQHT